MSEAEAATPTEATAPQGEPIVPADESPPPEAIDERTGVAAVDAALERLRDVDAAPVEAHVEIFDDVQRQLHDALAELDDGQ